MASTGWLDLLVIFLLPYPGITLLPDLDGEERVSPTPKRVFGGYIHSILPGAHILRNAEVFQGV